MLSFLAPKFIKEFDKKLLLNYPFWYIVKIHYILYFTILMWLLSILIGFLVPINISEYSPENVGGIWIFVFAVLAVILFCVWMYHLTIYNNEDHFGKYSKWDDVKFLIIFMVGINLLMSFSYPMQWLIKERIGSTFSDTEIAKQYNKLNLGYKYMSNTLEDFQYCGYNVHDTVSYENVRKDSLAFNNGMYNYDLSKFKNFIKFKPYNDEFDYDIIFRAWGNKKLVESSEFRSALMDAVQIENEYTNHTNNEQKLKAINSYFDVIKIYENKYDEYQGYNQYSPKDYLDNYNHYEKKCVSIFPEAYNYKETPNLESGDIKYLPDPSSINKIDNIYKAKFDTIYLISITYLTFCFYFSFFISILMILFRNNFWQHYLVTAVSVILLLIIVGIFSLISSTVIVYPTLCILIWFAAGFLSINNYFKNDMYRVVGVVATNIFYSVLPIMPFFLCVYAHEIFGWLKCDYTITDEYQRIVQCNIAEYTFSNVKLFSQIIGILAFVIKAMPFYKVYFTKQKALPKEK